jgi:hypothetical protein
MNEQVRFHFRRFPILLDALMIKNHIVAHYNAKVTQETNYIYEQYDNHVIHVDLINDVYNLATP